MTYLYSIILVSFQISPSYVKAIEPSKAKNLDELQKFQQARGSLLVMRVGAKSKENIQKIASVYRRNFEEVIPLYSEKEELNKKIIDLKENIKINDKCPQSKKSQKPVPQICSPVVYLNK